MAYSTGSGDYIALMNAVLTHAIADGWTTTGGNWPISKGIVRGVDWSTFTANFTDFTALGGALRTCRLLRLAVGTSPANATANAASTTTSATCFNMDRTFTNWWIFSNPGAGKPDYIHVVFKFSNGPHPDCYGHFSFGEINKHGMPHTGTIYATTQVSRAFASGLGSSFNTSQSKDWNDPTFARCCMAFSGYIGIQSTTIFGTPYTPLRYIVDPTVSPLPIGSGWPSADALNGPDLVVNTTAVGSGGTISINSSINRSIIDSSSNNASLKWSTWPMLALPQPYSAGLSLGSLPMLVSNGTGSSASVMMLGSYPDVFTSSVEVYAPEDEVTIGAEVFKLFPVQRKTSWGECGVSGSVTSGNAAFAYKKVV